jgi:polyisoprenoid-binding protein YceI
MNKLKIAFIAAGLVLMAAANGPRVKLVTKSGHAKLFSHTSLEDIEANNYKVTSSLDTVTGDMVFSVPMQSFEFEKAMMQKHYNSPKFLDTKKYPKSKFKGKITDLTKVDFSEDGTYEVSVKGDLTLHGVTKNITEDGKITVKDGKINATSTFNLTLADYEIEFKKGKPSTNIAKTVEITVDMNYNE